MNANFKKREIKINMQNSMQNLKKEKKINMQNNRNMKTYVI